MTAAEHEAARLDALHRLEVLDTEPEPAFDDLARVAALICRTPVALVSLIDDTRQWFKARIGIDAHQTPRSVAFCDHAIRSPQEVMIVPDAAEDVRFRDNPLVTGEPNIRFYAGAPLVTGDGFPIGTLCTIDQRPRTLTAEQTDALAVLARQVVTQLELRRANAALQELHDEARLPPECAVTMCAWTNTLRVGGGPWVSVERFLREKVSVDVGHGISDEALRRLVPPRHSPSAASTAAMSRWMRRRIRNSSSSSHPRTAGPSAKSSLTTLLTTASISCRGLSVKYRFVEPDTLMRSSRWKISSSRPRAIRGGACPSASA